MQPAAAVISMQRRKQPESTIRAQTFFKVENNSLELTRIIQNICIDPIVSARKKAEKRGRHEEREKERDISASTPSS